MPTRPFPKRLSLCVLLSLFLSATAAKTLLLDESDENTHACLYPADIAHPGSGDRPGAPGFLVFSFNATKPGETVLVLKKYLRPFAKSARPAKCFTYSSQSRSALAPNQALAPKT
jgi:hypothetical protein